MINQLKKLFLACFSDPPLVVDEIFANFVTDKNAFYIFAEDTLASALYVVDKELNFCGKTCALPFIMGVSTYPEFRGRGLSTQLLKKAVRSVNAPFVMLGTEIPDFYRKVGFTGISYSCNTKNVTLGEEISAEQMFTLYKDTVCGSDYYVEKKLVDFRIRIGLAEKSSSPFRYTLRGGKIAGYTDGLETVDTSPEKIPPFTMARVASLHALAALVEEMPFTFKLSDPIVQENNGIFAIKGGVLSAADKYDKILDISDLTALIFENLDGYIFDAY